MQYTWKCFTNDREKFRQTAGQKVREKVKGLAQLTLDHSRSFVKAKLDNFFGKVFF